MSSVSTPRYMPSRCWMLKISGFRDSRAARLRESSLPMRSAIGGFGSYHAPEVSLPGSLAIRMRSLNFCRRMTSGAW